MRPRTPSRRARDTAATKWREAFKRTVGLCEWCDKPGNAVHEIPRANLRKYVYTNPACILLLCDPGCHQIVGNWPKAKQAALLYLRRPGDYDLAVLNRWLVARVSQEDVDGFIAQLTGAK
jgi:hypothetical protein